MYFKSLKPADFIDLEVVQTQSEDDQEKEGVTKDDIIEDAPESIEEETEDTEQIDPAMEEPLENEASYNGAQISSAIDIIAKVGEGVLTKEQATVFLIQFLQLPPAVAKGFFSDTASAVEKLAEELKKKKSKNKNDLSDDDLNLVFEELKGEQINTEKWEIVDEQDEGLIDDYEENKSRRFCRNMMTLAQAGFVYRIEDIDKATREGVNRQLGHKGKPYDLFRFKGGVYCRHAWKVILYRLKEGTELKDGQSLDNDYNKVSSMPKRYVRKPKGIKEAETAPVNMPNEGHYPGVK